jgi:hypothetical protein
MLALAGGIGSTAIAEALDPAVYGRAALTALTGIPPLAVIPEIITPAERRSRMTMRIAAVIAALVALVAALLAIHFLYQPLDVLWFRAMRKFGLVES